ncbi:unnamed protein product [Acanthoscelides obtectus]|uniref:Uncharacterized protein n=1 Tax=Acanthoscelides obtectus TaxID=200917 RepID=A0A9P0JT46_ACAOB|nr:unnamed protein product [Acanthoscelides obtectus]CAK1671299.1 hypothetical protein AOBTE_LOCUS28212 [Acanthoscelides obtectus]
MLSPHNYTHTTTTRKQYIHFLSSVNLYFKLCGSIYDSTNICRT